MLDNFLAELFFVIMLGWIHLLSSGEGEEMIWFFHEFTATIQKTLRPDRKKINQFWGRILGRNPDKSLKSFPPCYSESPLQLCLEISTSSNSRNLLQFLQCVTVHYKGERKKPWWFKKSKQKPQVWELSRLWPETSTWLCVHEFGFRSQIGFTTG